MFKLTGIPSNIHTVNIKSNRAIWSLMILGLVFSCSPVTNETEDPVAATLKYQSWEETIQPQGSPAYLAMGMYAKVFCTAVFESGRDPEEAFQNSGRMILDPKYHDDVRFQIDYNNQEVSLTLGDSIVREARYLGDQGCIIKGAEGIQYETVPITSALGPAVEMDWPMGDRLTEGSEGYNQALLDSAKWAAFLPQAHTAAFVVVHQGNIIAEDYGSGAHANMQLESWSMGKSLTATLIGRLIQEGQLTLDQEAPVGEWATPGDPRGKITISNLLQMSSGLRFPAHHDPELEEDVARLAHMYIYNEALNVFDFAVNRPLEFEPGSTGRYRNCDPLTLGYILRQLVEGQGRNYWKWPQEELFDKIGIRRQVLETDPYGNFIMTGYDYGTARNWARLGLLYLQEGKWNGQQLIPESFVRFVSTPATSWDPPVYGGLFWLNTTEELAVPKDAFYMAGGGGQRTIIVPSLDLVVVRMGHSSGSQFAGPALNDALAYIVRAISDK